MLLFVGFLPRFLFAQGGKPKSQDLGICGANCDDATKKKQI